MQHEHIPNSPHHDVRSLHVPEETRPVSATATAQNSSDEAPSSALVLDPEIHHQCHLGALYCTAASWHHAGLV